MEEFYSKDILIGIKVSSFSSGTHPITNSSESIQIITLKQPVGTEVKIHGHRPEHRVTTTLQECLIVKKGKIKIELYGQDKKHVTDIIINAGEFFILLNGIWAVHFLEDSEVVEVKNGPYKDDKISIEL